MFFFQEPERELETPENVAESLEEMSENVTSKYEKLTAEEDEFHKISVQKLLVKAITHLSPIEDIEIILKFGADPNGCVERGMRPIHYAAYANNVEAIDFLLDYGCEVNPKDDFGLTPIHLCAEKGYITCLTHLLKHGAEVKFGTNYEKPENVEEFKENTENDTSQTTDTEDNLNATETGNGDGAMNEVRDSDSVDTQDRIPEEVINDLTVEPLNLALENNRVEIVKLLLENGAEPNRRYFGGYEINLMPLKYFECLELLLDYGANPNVVNRRGLTPLMMAAKENENRAVRLLLSKGADINQQCHERFEQKTALHIALESGHRGIVRTLCLQNAIVSKLPNYKYNALHTAVLTDRVDLVELILLFPIDINEFSDDNCTALMMACASQELNNQKEIIYKLLQYGANPNSHSDIINYSGPYLSPLIEYFDNQTLPDYEVVLRLIQYGAMVHFSRRTSVARKKDPFGILAYIPIIMDKPDIWNLLVSACSYFDVNAVSICMHFTKEEKRTYSLLGQTPLPLRHIVRLSIRQLLQHPLIENILKLPLPVFLLKYLLFLTT